MHVQDVELFHILYVQLILSSWIHFSGWTSGAFAILPISKRELDSNFGGGLAHITSN